jgi:hypothetical protein
MSLDTSAVDAKTLSHEPHPLDLVLKNVDVTCVVCLEVCMRNMIVCLRGHSLCYDCAIRVCCANENRCPTCRAMTFSIEECTPDLTKNSICELVLSVKGGAQLAKNGRLSMMEREKQRREHVACQRNKMRSLVGELRTLSESLWTPVQALRVRPMPVHWRSV